MAGIFDLLMTATGHPDPNQQIAAALGRAPGQPGGGGPNPLQPPPVAGAGDSSSAPPTAGGAPAPAPPQPQAYQSQPDMLSLYAQSMQRYQANDMFYRGLGLLGAGMYPGRHPELLMNAMSGMAGPNPSETFGNMMKIQQYQMQNQRLAGLQAAIPGLVKSGIIDPSLVPILQNSPDMVPGIVAAHQPEGLYRNWLLAREDAVKNSGADPNDPQAVAKAKNDFEQKNPLINALTPSGGDPELNMLNFEKNDWQFKHPGEPLPDDGRFNSVEDLKSYKNRVNNLSNTQNAASGSLPTLDYALNRMKSSATAVLNAGPDLQTILDKFPNILSAGRANGWLVSKLPAEYGGISQDQLDLLHNIDELTNSDTAPLKQANTHLASGFVPIDADLAGLKKFDIGSENYTTKLKSLISGVDTLRATAIGASGQLDKALNDPTIDQSKVDDSYLPGGKNYLGEPKKLPPNLVSQAKQAIAAGADRNAIIRRYKLMGYLPKGEF